MAEKAAEKKAPAKKTAEKKETAVKKPAAKKATAAKKAAEKPAPEAVKVVEQAAPAAEKKAPAAKKTAEKKPAAKKAAKKSAPVIKTILQVGGEAYDISGLAEKALKDYKSVHKRKAVSEFVVYVKPEEDAAYFTVNGEGGDDRKLALEKAAE